MTENALSHIPLERRDAFAPSLVLSLILHVFFLGVWSLSPQSPRYTVTRAPSSMEIVLVEAPSLSERPSERPDHSTVPVPHPENKIVPDFSEEMVSRGQSPKASAALAPAEKPYNRISPGAATTAERLEGIINPAPVYPASARRQGWEGTVIVRVHVRADGLPGQVMIEKSSGHRVLDDAASETIQQWKFKPAEAASRAQNSWVTIPVRFALVDE